MKKKRATFADGIEKFFLPLSILSFGRKERERERERVEKATEREREERRNWRGGEKKLPPKTILVVVASPIQYSSSSSSSSSTIRKFGPLRKKNHFDVGADRRCWIEAVISHGEEKRIE